ncbi:MAG: sulfite exporter TauE/SafE family protein [Candidatus Magnetoovum sp. WYHC-5]|nr:sulfite exporter TauE/SafE family protein [Candidatus Magnetoovum sp. WYHC-5]
MDYGLLITLFVIGVVGAFVSGMLGLGGAIILVPLLLYVPPMIGVGVLTMKQVAGITIIVVFASALSGLFVHNKNRLVLKSLVLIMGITAVIAAFLGAVYSKQTSSDVLLGIFAFMAAFAAVIMVIPKKEADNDVELETIKFSKVGAIIISCTIGFIGGMVGAPGAYIFTPMMIYFLKIPTKVAIGSTLGIAFVASISGAVGKLVTGQVPYLLTATVVVGAIPAARVGAKFTKKIPAQALRKALAVVIAFAAIGMWWDVLTK